MDLPKITIVMPSYNQGEYIEESICSVLNQNYPHLEFIVVDGGSTDDSINIIRKYEEFIDYWISEKDEGQTHAINKGLRISSGSIINWLNSDDILAKNALKKIALAFVNNNIDVVYGRSHLIDQSGYVIRVRNTTSYSSKALWVRSSSLTQPAVFFKADLIDKVGLLDEDLNYVMDMDFYLRLDKAGAKFFRGAFTVNFFRVHDIAKSVADRNKLNNELDRIFICKHNNPVPRNLRKVYWLFYRTKRYLVNIPYRFWYSLYTLMMEKLTYKEYQDRFIK